MIGVRVGASVEEFDEGGNVLRLILGHCDFLFHGFQEVAFQRCIEEWNAAEESLRDGELYLFLANDQQCGWRQKVSNEQNGRGQLCNARS